MRLLRRHRATGQTSDDALENSSTELNCNLVCECILRTDLLAILGIPTTITLDGKYVFYVFKK